MDVSNPHRAAENRWLLILLWLAVLCLRFRRSSRRLACIAFNIRDQGEICGIQPFDVGFALAGAILGLRRILREIVKLPWLRGSAAHDLKRTFAHCASRSVGEQ